MVTFVNIGDKLFHKYLGEVTVTHVSDSIIKADTGARGVLDFAFYDFGKVLYFDKDHSVKSYSTYMEYVEFNEEDKKINHENEEKIKRERDRERERGRLRKIEEDYKKGRDKQKKIEIQEEAERKLRQIQEEQKYNKVKQQKIIQEEIEAKIYFSSELMDMFLPKRETLIQIKKEQEAEIERILEKRGIKYFVHFTRLENLSSILENGLIPVSLQNEKNIISIHNDEQRIDSQLDCTSCSVGFPNYKLFYTFREYKYPGTQWVVIILNTDILFSPDNIVYYCHTNAAGVLPRVSNVGELCTADSFKNMFCNSVKTKENKIIQRKELEISDNLTTDPQAEILISDVIHSKYISCICFYDQRHIDHYISKNGENQLNNFDYQVVPGFYNPRKDYMFWQKEI